MVDTIAIASGKGGVGKTSLAVNCAVKLSLDNKRLRYWMPILAWLTRI